MLGLRCSMSFSPVAASGGFSLTAVLRLLVAAASLIVEPGLRVCGLWVCGLSRCGSQALELRLSCSVACGMFPDQGSDLCLLHGQAASLPLSR